MKESRRIRVRGIVQGVGFRPFVYGLATRAGLVGQVLNDAAGVTIEVEGETAVLDTFTTALQTEAPPLAIIEQLTAEILPPSYNEK
jgi:hydrogenase maturation protein HypF